MINWNYCEVFGVIWYYTFETWEKHLPGHTTKLQLSVLEGLPTQSVPNPCGVGFVQVRVRIREPPPQVSVQPDHDVHCVQPPFTVW